MAQKTIVRLEDDLDGGEADETVAFAVSGQAYEIDLSSNNANKFRDALAGYIGSARKVSRPGRTAKATRATTAGDREQNQAIREWAKSNGLNVSERGRIPAGVVEKYHAEINGTVAINAAAAAAKRPGRRKQAATN